MADTKVVTKVVTEVAIERKAVELDKATADAIVEWVRTKDLLNSLEKTKKALDEQIKDALGDAEVGILDGVVRIEKSIRSRTGLDTEALKTAFPEAFAACQVTTPYTVLVAK